MSAPGPAAATASDTQWYPVASSDDLPFRHVFHGQLLGRELAVWRADDGYVNVWENRCLHRGVRLSIGSNDGAELKCQYHGWRYANRSAGCTYIPAHPADAPARRISNRTYPMREQGGLVWSALSEPAGEPPSIAPGLVLRPIPINARPEDVLAALAEAADEVVDEVVAPFALVPSGLNLRWGGAELTVFVQPVDSARAVLRGILHAAPDDAMAALRDHNTRLTALRDRCEARARQSPPPEPIAVHYAPVSVELATMPDLVIGREAPVRVVVRRKWSAATDVIGLELAPVAGHLPTFQPGAHIDLHLPNGQVRQYSITNGPGELLSYRIAVKREAGSRGGSQAVADTLREGDVLAISEPRNNFPLRRDAVHSLFIAGGIGMTPLLAMAKALHRQGLPFAFHLFARTAQHVPFADELERLGDSVILHLGLDAAETAAAITEILGPYGFARHAYLCGPSGLLEAARASAAAGGWPDAAVHFEYFGNDRPIRTDSSFVVELARSALTLAIPAGRSILEVLRENGVAAASSCEQGACGTCLTRVLEGEPEHQDVYLNASEKAAGEVMLTCVSRSRSPRLVLDI